MTNRAPIDLIVNADDYGYSKCISRGILAAARAEKLTATGILANSHDLQLQLEWLSDVKLELGVHLNISSGHPLTMKLAERLELWQGRFPNVYQMSLLILSNQIAVKLIRGEWQAQIEACRGKKLIFLNSHEHIHMLPVLFPVIVELAKDFQIPYVRLTRADWFFPSSYTALLRNCLIQSMSLINRFRLKTRSPVFIGLDGSGKLDINYLTKVFARLKPGASYELMCHPGYLNANEISNPRLLAYHNWENELALLLSPKLQELYKVFGIRLRAYQD